MRGWLKIIPQALQRATRSEKRKQAMRSQRGAPQAGWGIGRTKTGHEVTEKEASARRSFCWS